jgi:uncharacterized protein (DUF697 family)
MIDTLASSSHAAQARRSGAMSIVHRYTMISAAAGVLTVPVLDVAALGVVHIALIKNITEYYGAEFSEHTARNILIGVGVSLVPGTIGSVLSRKALQILPFVTPGLGLAAMSACSAGVSYSLGAAFVRHYESGGTLDGFNLDRLHGTFGLTST